MDLLNMLSGLMTDSSSIDALSQKTGTDSAETKGIVDAALPMLVGALKKNTSSEEGANSLLGALKQHTNTSSLKDQIAEADSEDGGKIIKHILGDDQSSALASISEKTGAGTEKISSLLSNLAPSLLSSLSAVTSASAKKSDDSDSGLGLSSLLGILGGGSSQSESSGGLGSLLGGLGGLFGGKDSDSNDKDSDSPLLGMLKSFLK